MDNKETIKINPSIFLMYISALRGEEKISFERGRLFQEELSTDKEVSLRIEMEWTKESIASAVSELNGKGFSKFSIQGEIIRLEPWGKSLIREWKRLSEEQDSKLRDIARAFSYVWVVRMSMQPWRWYNCEEEWMPEDYESYEITPQHPTFEMKNILVQTEHNGLQLATRVVNLSPLGLLSKNFVGPFDSRVVAWMQINEYN